MYNGYDQQNINNNRQYTNIESEGQVIKIKVGDVQKKGQTVHKSEVIDKQENRNSYKQINRIFVGKTKKIKRQSAIKQSTKSIKVQQNNKTNNLYFINLSVKSYSVEFQAKIKTIIPLSE